MFDLAARVLLMTGIGCLAAVPVCAQTGAGDKAPAPTVEYGLETAVNWKWWVVPSNPQDWGLPQAASDPQQPGATPGSTSFEPRPASYEIQRGDALVKIANKYGVTVEQLKAFNSLTNDLIHVGDVLKIPSLEDIKKMAPPPPPPGSEKKHAGEGVPDRAKALAPIERREMNLPSGRNWDTVLLQVFLDREQFATGSIDGRAGPTFEKTIELYQSTHAGLEDPLVLKEKAKEVVDDPFAVYTLKPDDFRFIMPVGGSETAEAATGSSSTRGRSRKGKRSSAASAPPPPTYEELVAASRLVYRTPWEFVAERFHCEEAFLRSLNPNLKGSPVIGAQLHVPNVVPFEIEKVFEGPLQPAVDPAKPVTAAVVGLSRLEIYRAGTLIAAMPIALARPDLRGRGTWTIREAVPGPRLATLQELKSQGKTSTSPAATPSGIPTTPATPAPPPPEGIPLPGPAQVTPAPPPVPAPSETTPAPGAAQVAPAPTPVPTPTEATPSSAPVPAPPAAGAPASVSPAESPSTAEQQLAAGPNNPVGVVWIHLTKGKGGEPLPYGLHGTSIPDRMRTLEGIGGLRLANWDILRAVRLLPAGTPLQWK